MRNPIYYQCTLQCASELPGRWPGNKEKENLEPPFHGGRKIGPRGRRLPQPTQCQRTSPEPVTLVLVAKAITGPTMARPKQLTSNHPGFTI